VTDRNVIPFRRRKAVAEFPVTGLYTPQQTAALVIHVALAAIDRMTPTAETAQARASIWFHLAHHYREELAALREFDPDPLRRLAERHRAPRERDADLEERNRLLRLAAATLWPGRSASFQAERLRAELLRYPEAKWDEEQGLDVAPIQYRGLARQWIWRIRKTHDDFPNIRQLRRILAMNAAMANDMHDPSA
jgi:hypothetical protein